MKIRPEQSSPATPPSNPPSNVLLARRARWRRLAVAYLLADDAGMRRIAGDVLRALDAREQRQGHA